MPVRGPRYTAMVACWAVGCVIAASNLSPVSGQTLTNSRGRKLAPDVLRVIPPGQEQGDTAQGPVDLPFVRKHSELAWIPNYAPKSSTLLEQASGVTFRGDAYCLEFAFKPVRMIDVEVPTAEGYRIKRVWYMVYRVRYLGADFRPKQDENRFNNKVYSTEAVSAQWVRFFPDLQLESKGLAKPKLDEIIFAAKQPIANKERIGKPLHDSVEMQTLKIKLSTEAEDNAVWGLATWTDIDPRTDFFSVEVRGLSNSQEIVETPDGDFKYLRKTLELFFSRPGDSIAELEDQIRFGIPAITDLERRIYVLEQFDVEERLDYRWVYR